MSKGQDNKAVVGRGFTLFWGETIQSGCRRCHRRAKHAPEVLAARTAPGPQHIKAFMADFRRAFPDLRFWGTAELIAEGD